MKTLYITDMDGTLLNSDKIVTQYSVDTINKLIAQGMHFTVATARSCASAVSILQDINITTPAVLMNGVLVYDVKKQDFVKIEWLKKETTDAIIAALHAENITGFMYSIENQRLCTYYEDLYSEHLRDFYQERVDKYYKKFQKTTDFATVLGDKIYFTLIDLKSKIMPVYERLKDIEGISIEVYKDNYSPDQWYLECFSSNATKYNAAMYLRDTFGYDKVIGFGDNLNDIQLLKACDEGYAVENAREELKNIATAVVGKNNDDGVAKWLEDNYERL